MINPLAQLAMGVPLIGAIYDNDPNVGLYTLPLLVWYPMQLVGGSSLTVKLLGFVHDEKIRLGINDEETDDMDPYEDEIEENSLGVVEEVEESVSKESSSKRSWQRQQGLGYIQEEGDVSQDCTSSKASKSGTGTGTRSRSGRRLVGDPSLVADTSITSRSYTRDYHSRADDSSDLSWWSELASLEFDVDSVRSFDIYKYPHRPTYGPGPDLSADDQPTPPAHDQIPTPQPMKPGQRGP